MVELTAGGLLAALLVAGVALTVRRERARRRRRAERRLAWEQRTRERDELDERRRRLGLDKHRGSGRPYAVADPPTPAQEPAAAPVLRLVR